jgi:uncharacterized protein (DUF2236 family)
MEEARQPPSQIEIDEMWERMRDRKVRDHFSSELRLGVRTDQSVTTTQLPL